MIGAREGGLRMTTEQRLARLEETDRILAELAQRQQEQLDGIIKMLQRQEEQLARQREELAEVREDTNMTRRMWVRLAKKHGWLDDEDVEGA